MFRNRTVFDNHLGKNHTPTTFTPTRMRFQSDVPRIRSWIVLDIPLRISRFAFKLLSQTHTSHASWELERQIPNPNPNFTLLLLHKCCWVWSPDTLIYLCEFGKQINAILWFDFGCLHTIYPDEHPIPCVRSKDKYYVFIYNPFGNICSMRKTLKVCNVSNGILKTSI